MSAFLHKKIFKYIAIILITFITLSIYLFVYEPKYKGLISPSEQTLIFAHRGFGNHAPDNSLEGARIAIANDFDGVDVDAQFSKDKEIVIFHDVSLERFTTGKGRIDAKELKELQTYDLGMKYGKGFSGVFIKTFEDFVQEVTPKAYLMVELKVSTISETGIEQSVNEILAKHKAYDRVYISSFNPMVLYRLKKINPQIRTVFIFMDSNWDPKRIAETKEADRVTLPWYLQKEWARVLIRKIIKPDALSIQYQVDETVINKLTQKGYPIFLWPVNDESSIIYGLNKQPYGLVTDEPPLTKKLRDSN